MIVKAVTFTAADAWEYGYGYAVRGIIRHVPRGTWMADFSADFLAGWDAAVADGRWGTVQ